jgi:hypothetical protein
MTHETSHQDNIMPMYPKNELMTVLPVTIESERQRRREKGGSSKVKSDIPLC